MPTNLVWTSELIGRFWDGLSQMPVLDKLSFGRLAGPGVLELAAPRLPADAVCLDFGGGDGHFAEVLLQAGFRCASYEPSAGRARHLNERLGGNPNFLGVIAPGAKMKFDAVFCLEVIEHVLPTELKRFVRSLSSLLKDDGQLFMSCPFNEDLDAGFVYCPNCDSAFHRWQHLRSIGAGALRSLVEPAGLETVWQGIVGFANPGELRRYRQEHDRWPDNFADETDRLIPIVAGGGNNFLIARRRRDLTLGHFHDLALAKATELLAEVQSRGAEDGDIVLLLPAQPEAAAPRGMRYLAVPRAFRSGDDNDAATEEDDTAAFSNGDRDGSSRPGVRNLVFPGPLRNFLAIAKDGLVPTSVTSWIWEESRWRRLDPLDTASNATQRRARSGAAYVGRIAMARTTGLASRAINTKLPRAMKLLKNRHDLQPYVDYRHHALSGLLHKPAGFPFRMRHVVEGRIVLGISSLYSGGAERQMVYTAQGLAARGYGDLHAVVEYLDHDTPQSFFFPQLQRATSDIWVVPDEPNEAECWMDGQPGWQAVHATYLTRRILNMAEHLSLLGPEIVQASLDWTSITVGLAAVLAGVPNVFLSGRNLRPAHFEFFNTFMYPSYRALYEQPNVHLLNNSMAGAADYESWLRLPRGSIRVIRNGVDLKGFPPAERNRTAARKFLNLPEDGRVVAGAFRFSDEKRPLMWVEAAAMILAAAPDTYFVVMGQGPMMEATKARAAGLGLGGRIIFPGTVDDIAFCFAAADVVMLASRLEGTPNVLIEAQAIGIPVVTTAAHGAAEAVADGESGRVVRVETARNLADAALSVLGDRAFRERAAAAGPAFVAERFGMERMIDDTLGAYAAAGIDWALKAARVVGVPA